MIQMVEPVTASIGVYLLTRPHQVIRPRRLCVWVKQHRRELMLAAREELAEPVFDMVFKAPSAGPAALYFLLLALSFLL
jgi:hypothetical protein